MIDGVPVLLCGADGAEWIMEGVDDLTGYALELEGALDCWEAWGNGKLEGSH